MFELSILLSFCLKVLTKLNWKFFVAIIYEINPPKIPDGEISNEEIDSSVEKLLQRVSDISNFCDGIHVTDSVLGTKRVSALSIGRLLKNIHPNLQITISMRVRDKDMNLIKHLTQESIELKLDGILILKGDPSKENPTDSGLIPSQVVKELNELGYGGKSIFSCHYLVTLTLRKFRKKLLPHLKVS